MPYIDEKAKQHLDGSIEMVENALFYDINGYSFGCGNVNYVITRLLIKWWKRNPRYVTICLIMGTLFSVALEFYRRIAVDYEHRKQHENGDVY